MDGFILWPPETVRAILSLEDPAPSLQDAARKSPADADLWLARIPFAVGLVWCMTARAGNTVECKLAKQYCDILRREYPSAARQSDTHHIRQRVCHVETHQKCRHMAGIYR